MEVVESVELVAVVYGGGFSSSTCCGPRYISFWRCAGKCSASVAVNHVDGGDCS